MITVYASNVFKSIKIQLFKYLFWYQMLEWQLFIYEYFYISEKYFKLPDHNMKKLFTVNSAKIKFA